MNKLNFAGLLIVTSLFVISCNQAPKSDEAEVTEAKEVAEVTAEAQYTILPEASEVTWVGTKPGGRHNGTIEIKEGALKVNNGEVVGGNFTMNLNQIEVLDLEGEDKGKLTGHLQSPDFFDVKNHPEARFEITSVEPYTAAAASDATDEEFRIENLSHKVTGNLTLRDSTLSISFPALIEMKDDKLVAKANFNIDRTNWGVSYGDESKAVDKAKDKFIYNTVNIGFNIEAK